MLNTDQTKAATIVKNGGNVFISGSGGHGKTFLVNQLKTKRTIVGAPTGAAALLVNGMTNHRLFELPIGVLKDSDKFRMKPTTKKVFQKADMLVLDEVSMLRADMLTLIDAKLKVARECDLPFGGLQTLAVGDFYQLGAFVGQNEKRFYEMLYGNKVQAFESDAWNFETVELTQPMRNTNRAQLEVLQAIRTGVEKEWAIAQINSIASSVGDMGDDVTHLCAYNKDADTRNNIKYNQLKTPEKTYIAEVKGDAKVAAKELRVAPVVSLKLGMKCMVVVNDPNDAYVNGTTGEIVQMEDDCVFLKKDNGEVIVVTPFKFEAIQYQATAKGMSKKVVASMSQIPLVPAWGMSIHRSQGSTLDKAIINLGGYSFSDALLYVASFTESDPGENYDIRVNQKVVEFYRNNQ